MNDGGKQAIPADDLARIRSAYVPTPEQFEALSRIKSFHEKENLLEEFALEALIAQEQSQAVDKPVDLAPEKKSEVVDTQTQSLVDPPKTKQLENEPLLHDEPPALETESEKGVDYWRQLAEKNEQEKETWKKRKGDADRALTPAQQEAARLRKESEKYEERLANMEKLLQQLAETKSRQTVELDPDDDVDTSYPDIARKIKQTTNALEDKLRKENEERIKAIEERNNRFEQENNEREQRMYADAHFVAVLAIHKDASDFFSPDKLGPAIVEWAKTQPEEIMDAITSPLSATPKYVAYIISQFKQATRYAPPPAIKPGLGDLATKVASVTQVKQPDASPDVFPSDYTEKQLDLDMRKVNNMYKSQPDVMNKALDDLINKYERTLINRSKS